MAKKQKQPSLKVAALNPAQAKTEKPKHPVGVSVLLRCGGQFLMAKRKNNSGAGFISTPGGRLEVDETIEQCAAREFEEECGALLGPVKIIGWKEHFRYGNHYIMFYALALQYFGTIVNLIPDKSEDWAWYSRPGLTEENCTEPQDILEEAYGIQRL